MSAYTGDIVKDGLTLYLDAANYKSFVSGSTTWYDLSASRYTGSLINGPAYTGSNKGAIVFDGSNDYVYLPPNFFNHNAGTPFSISVWFRANSGSSGIIFGQQNTSTPDNATGYVPAIYIGSDGKLYTSCFWGNATTNLSSSSLSVNDGNYYNITVTFASTVHRSYLNGELYATLSKTQTNYANPYYYFIGTGRGSGWQSFGSVYFTGRMGHFMFYNRELSAAEVRENYNATKGRYDTTRSSDAIKPRLSTSGLVLHLDAANYRSYTGSGTTWRDLSGNGLNGTLTNGPTYSSANNGSIVFDGTDDEVLVNNADSINFIGAQQYTVLAWVYPNLGGVTWHGIVSKGNSQQYALTINSTSAYLHYETNQGGPVALNSANNTVDLNTWQHFGIRYDGSTKTIWKNGVSIASQAATTQNSSTNTEQLRIGEGNNNEQYRGNIGVVQIYNRALSAAEIAQNFNTNKIRYGYVL